MRKINSGAKLSEHGITFERLANGDGLFTVNIMVDGQRIHRVIGRESEGTTRTHAEEFIQRVREDARQERLNLPNRRKIVLRFPDAAAKYLAKLAEEGGKDLVMKRRRLELHLVPFFHDMPLSKISSFDVERYKKRRIDEGARFGTINRELAALSHLFTKAVEWAWLTARRARIKRFPEDQGRIVYLTVEQADCLLEAAKADQNRQLYPFVRIGLDTSMRLMEILSIRRDNVDLERRMIYVRHAKAGSRDQPMTQELAAFLKDYMDTLPQDTPWLFPSQGSKRSKVGHTVDINAPFRRAVIQAGLNPAEVVRHTLRHTAITHLVQAGVDLPAVKRISGHKTLLMVERYSHQNGAHIQAAMDKLSARYRNTG